ncbi:MAG: hypothetical protein WCW27_00660 [Patescibacteria group bacterium]
MYKKIQPIFISLIFIILFSGCRQLSLSTNNTQSDQPIVSAVNTTTWQSYTNSTYGYSFKYPPTWHIDERLFQAFQHDTNQKVENILFLTNLTNDEVTEEINKYKNYQGIDSGWTKIAQGKIITVQASDRTINQIHSDELTRWLPGSDIITNSGITIVRFRQTSDYEIPTDAEHGFLPYIGTHKIDDMEIHSIDFLIERNNDTADIATFEAILKTVQYQ